MTLTQDFRETIQARAQHDPHFREALLAEALNVRLAGDIAVNEAILRDLENEKSA
jgi:hypothetical protein